VLALVLGPMAERALRQSLIISDAGLGIFFLRPIAAVLTVAALVAVAVPAVRALLAASRRRHAATASAGD
jgi:putative tricarboxylic transport membrane protein